MDHGGGWRQVAAVVIITAGAMSCSASGSNDADGATPATSTTRPEATAPTTTEAPTTTAAPTTTTPPTTAAPTTTSPPTAVPPETAPPATEPALVPGQACALGSHPDCIDPMGDGTGTYLIGGASCMAAFADSPGLCTDLDGDGYAGYPDSG